LFVELYKGILPSTHDITVATEHLSETAYNNICELEHVDVEEIANAFVDNNSEFVFISKNTYASQIWSREKWISRKLAEQREDLLQNLKCINVRKADYKFSQLVNNKILKRSLPVTHAFARSHVRQQILMRIEDGIHTTRIEIYIIFRYGTTSLSDILFRR
jgi:hypothetical protein